jgi:8-oxo-dGTP pyrophosphatase MutT (NUDIX family)
MTERALARWCAVALIVTPDRRYLMQLRDAKPGIFIPGHWGLFGGSVDRGESTVEALRRELFEELEFTAERIEPFTEMMVEMPFAAPRRDRLCFFSVPIEESDVDRMVLHEGAGMQLFSPEALTQEPRVAPWDLAAILMHARREALFAR